MKALQDYLDLAALLAPSLIVASAACLSCGVTGIYVSLRRESLLALALPQVVVLGTAVALMAHITPLPFAAIATAIALAILAWLRSRSARAAEVFVPLLYAAGISVAVLIVSGSSVHLMEVRNLFVGYELLVTDQQAWIVTPILLAAGFTVALLYRRWLLIAQAPEVARLAGLRPALWHTFFLLLLAIQIVVGTATLGLVLVIAMLFVPAAAVLPLIKRLPFAMFGAALIAIISLITGFILAVENDWPLSHSAAAVSVALALPAILISALKR